VFRALICSSSGGTVYTVYIYIYMGRREVCRGCCWGNLWERGHWGYPDVEGRIILKWIFKTFEVVVGTGWSWLRKGTGGRHL
jgi:hypothetical protein